MGESSPAWVPGQPDPVHREVRTGLASGVTGLYGDLPPGLGPLLEVAAELTARAFAAYAEGDWETCDGLVTEGCEACGTVFVMLTERVISPAFPYRVDDPAWEAFLARLAVMVLAQAPTPPPAPHVETDEEFMARLDRMVADAEAGKTRGDQRESRPAPRPVPQPPKPAAELAEPGALSESLRQMGLM